MKGMKCGGKAHKKGYMKGGMAKGKNSGVSQESLKTMGRNKAKAMAGRKK
jgi:hypothetical protein